MGGYTVGVLVQTDFGGVLQIAGMPVGVELGKLSTAYQIPHETRNSFDEMKLLRNDNISPLFMAAIEATEEAIVNSLFAAQTMAGDQEHRVEELPKQRVVDWLKRNGQVK